MILVNYTFIDPETIALTSFGIDSILKISLWIISPITITLLYFDLRARKSTIPEKLQVVGVGVPVAEG